MSTLLRSVVLVVIAAMVASALTCARVAEAAPGPTRVLIVGDSITHGSTGDYTWRYRLWRHLAESGAEVDFVGPRTDLWDYLGEHDGNQQYADRQFDRDHRGLWGESFTRLNPEIGALVRTHEPDRLVVALGFNDLAWCCSPAHTLELLRTFLDEVDAASDGVQVVVATVPSSRLAAAVTYNELLVDAEDELNQDHPGLVVADTSTGFDSAEHTFDATHPNANGELIIAAGVADALAETGVGAPMPRPLGTLPVGPTVPSVLQVRAGDHEAVLSWTAAPGATRHFVWRRDLDAGQDWTRLPDPVTGDGWTVDGLTNGHRYRFRVQAAKVWAVSPLLSAAVGVVPRPRVPPPTAIEAVVSRNHALRVRWARLAGVNTYLLRARRAGSRDVVQQRVAGGAATVTGLVAGARHQVTVRGVDRGVVGPASPVVRGRPWGPVVDSPRPRVRTVSHRAVRISWPARRPATRWEVRLRDRSIGGRWQVVRRLPGEQTFLRLGRLTAGHRYQVRLRGWHQQVRGTWSPVVGVRVRGR
ncbi:hypothetical protein FXB39_16215 [Nocardioides sp. BGMRC 2183]|nr:hypothetical protein FXB39_16215 [Nocardioides sp. BGMRC 2183]